MDRQIGCTHDVKHFLALDVKFDNLKPCFSQLTRQHITIVFRNLLFGRVFRNNLAIIVALS